MDSRENQRGQLIEHEQWDSKRALLQQREDVFDRDFASTNADTYARIWFNTWVIVHKPLIAWPEYDRNEALYCRTQWEMRTTSRAANNSGSCLTWHCTGNVDLAPIQIWLKKICELWPGLQVPRKNLLSNILLKRIHLHMDSRTQRRTGACIQMVILW